MDVGGTLEQSSLQSPVLRGIPPQTPVHKFESIDEMVRICRVCKENASALIDTYAVFHSCDTGIFPHKALQSMQCYIDLDYDKSVVVVKIPTQVTKRFTAAVTATFREAEKLAGFDGSFSHVALSYIKTPTRLREAIARWQPSLDNVRPDGSTWPSLAIEYYLTDQPPNMEHDVQFWLDDSQGQTRMVLTVVINVSMKIAFFRVWTRESKEGTDQTQVISRQQCRVHCSAPDENEGSHMGQLLTFEMPVIVRENEVALVDKAEVTLSANAMVRIISFSFASHWPQELGGFAIG